MATQAEVENMQQLATMQRRMLDAEAKVEHLRQAHNALVGEHAALKADTTAWTNYVKQYMATFAQALNAPRTFTPVQPSSWGPVLVPLMPVQPNANPANESARRPLPARAEDPTARKIVAITPDPLTQGWPGNQKAMSSWGEDPIDE